mgnify:CR=1 FL=1
MTQTNSLPDIHNIGGEWVINQMLTDLLIEQEYIRKRERENWGWRKEVYDFSMMPSVFFRKHQVTSR